jgi:hypothetical protein
MNYHTTLLYQIEQQDNHLVTKVNQKNVPLSVALRPPDERLGPNLLRGRGKSICGDLDIDDEGSK